MTSSAEFKTLNGSSGTKMFSFFTISHLIMKIHSTIILPCILLYGCSGLHSPSETTLLKSPKAVGDLVTQDLLSRSDFMMYKTEGVTAVHYAEVCAAYGASKLAAKNNDTETLNLISDRYDRVIDESIPNTANHVDANVYGILPLELYIHTKKKIYLDQGMELANGQWENPLPNGLTNQTRFWIDDVYMVCSLQLQAFRATGKSIYLERAALEANAYVEKLQQPNGLYYHGENAPFYWGRGNGWVAAGLAELLIDLPPNNPFYNTILAGYKKMMATLLKYQGEDGMWHQLINRKDSFKETSSTAMFAFAMAVGVNKGILPKKTYEKAYIKAWNALTTYLTPEGKIKNVCVGTGQSTDIDYYLNRPTIVGDFHGQAPMLWLAYSLSKD